MAGGKMFPHRCGSQPQESASPIVLPENAYIMPINTIFLSVCTVMVLCLGPFAQRKTSAPSGIEGTVLLGPRCPGPQRVDRPCPDAPYKALLVVKRISDGEVVVRTQSDERGRFHAALPPGRYLIVNENTPGRYPIIYTGEIVVPPHQFIVINVHADTGMR